MKPILLHSHIRPLTQLKFNREGDLLFSSGKDHSPFVWRASNGEKVGSYDGHTGSVWSVDVSYNTDRVATAGADALCKIFDAETGVVVHDIRTETAVRTTCFAKDNILTITTDAAMGKPCEIQHFDLRDSAQMSEGKPFRVDGNMDRTNKITCAALGIHDEVYITGHINGQIIQWDRKTGEKIKVEKVHENQVNDLQRSVDGDCIVSASKDTTAKLLDIRNLDVIREYKTPQAVNSAAVSSLKDHVITGGGQDHHEVTTTDARSGKFVVRFYHKIYETEIGRVKGHFGPINSVVFHPNGHSFVSGGEDGFIRYHNFDDSYYDFEYEY